MNSTVQSGRLTKDADVKQTNSGKSIAFFTLAFDTSRKDEYGNWVNDSNFIDCKYFKQYRIDALKKGAAIVVSGSLKQESWEKDGKKNSKMVIMVDDIVFCDQTKKETPAPDKSPETKQDEDVPF